MFTVWTILSNKALNIISSVAENGEDIFLERFNVLSNEEIAELSQSLLKAQNLIIKMRDLYEDKKTIK